MQELTQILQYEQEKKEEVEKIKKDYQDKIAKKKEEWQRKMTEGPFLSDNEKEEMEKDYKKKATVLLSKVKGDIEKELDEVLMKKEKNIQKAIDYLVDSFGI